MAGNHAYTLERHHTIDHTDFQDQTKVVLDSFLKNLDHLERIFTQLFNGTRHKIILTNVNIHKRDHATFATSFFNNTITHTEILNNRKDVYHFELQEYKLTVNGMAGRPQDMNVFITKMENAMDELHKKKAMALEVRT